MSTQRFVPWVSFLVFAGACNGLVGIEDIYEGPRPGAGGANSGGGADSGGGTESDAGGKPDGGALATGGAGDALGGDGNAVPQGGNENESMGGAVGAAGELPTASGGEGGGGPSEPAAGRVTGRVIDFWRHPLPNISVQIGDTLATTDKNGVFVVDDVAPTYNVSLSYTYTTAFQVTAWAYLGLTRRDPTLQIYVGSARRTGDLEIGFNPKPTLATNQKISVALGGADGAEAYDGVSASGTTEFPDWYGPAVASQTAHALLWQTTAQKVPTSYIAYKSATVTLNETDTTALTLNLAPSTITTGNISGTVTSPGAAARRNSVFLRFTSNATIKLVSETAAANSFSYLVPSLASSSLLVAASEGSAYNGFAVAYADGLAVGAKPNLTIPTPMTPATPSSGAVNVDGTTRFSYGGDTKGPYVISLYSQDPDDPNAPASRYQAVYVVTAKKQLTLPTFLGGGFKLYPNRRYVWTVATHGAYESVDALASEAGFLDPFSWDEETPQGPSRGTGEFTDSDTFEFRTAP